MYNLPSYDPVRFSFGPGILYLGVPGTTPLIDVGATKGNSELTIERTPLEVKLGSPKVKVAQYITEEKVSFKISGIEWDLDNLSYALGAGMTSISGAAETMEFGGDMNMSNRALRFVHRQPDGATIDLQMFKVMGSGKIAVSFNAEDMHEFPFEFQAMDGTSDFSNAALADKKKLFKIVRTKA